MGTSGLMSGDEKRDDALPSAPALVLDSTTLQIACSLPDILRSALDTFGNNGSTEVLRCPSPSSGYTLYWIGKRLAASDRAGPSSGPRTL